MKSIRTKAFNERFDKLPIHIQRLAKEAYRHFQEDPNYPGLQFKCINKNRSIYSARVGNHYRVLGLLEGDTISWFWIGTHEDYNKLINQG